MDRLWKLKAHPSQVKAVLKNKPKKYIPKEEPKTRPIGNISANGTKPIDIKHFKSNTHFIAPAYNKGPVMVCSVTDIKTVGKKV